MERITVRTPGKINLTLDVLGNFANGYHDLQMVMSEVKLFDEITITKQGQGIALEIDQPELPVDERNLAYKAVALLKEEFALKEGIHLSLKKTIPVAAGMAGGSADAAGVLKGMNQLFQLGLTLEELQVRGLKLGADVPFCLLGGCALAEGVGERLTSLKPLPQAYLVLVKPDFSVSTPWVFSQIDREVIQQHPDTRGILAAIEEGELAAIADKLCNVLELVTVKAYPVIQEIKDCLEGAGALKALMTGSGPTVYGIFAKEDTAQGAAQALAAQQLAAKVYVVKVGK